jgi:type I restriction enzyme S subunit
VNAGWLVVKLGDVCTFVRGPFGGSLKKSMFVSSGYAVYEQQHAIHNQFEDIRYFVNKKQFQEMQRFEIQGGDLIMSCSGTMGRVAIVPKNVRRGIINQALLKLTPAANILNTFLQFWMESEAFQDAIKEYSGGAAIQNVASVKILKEIKVPLPSVQEQKRIVAILDQASEGIATAKVNAEKNLENARAIFDGQLESVFTQGGERWVETTIGEQIRFIDYRGKTPVKTAHGIRLITAKNVKMGFLQDTPMEYIAAGNYKTWMTRGIPEKGDVLFTTEAPLANVAQLDRAERVAFAQRIIIMQTKPETLDSTFLKYLLLSQPIQHRIRTRGTGATVQGIKASLLKTIEIAFPRSLVEQKRLVTKLEGLSDETQRLASIYERKLAALDALKKSLVHLAFAGELTANGTSELIEAVA